MSLETRNFMDGSELREGIGLQYFAEDGNSSDNGADMDGFSEADFLSALEGKDGLENQQADTDGGAEEQSDGLENQQAEPEQQSEPEDQPPEGGNNNPPEQAEQPVQTVPLVFNGQQIMLPAEAVSALQGALGANPVELLQKGMNYENKASRELRVLDQYASAAGMSRQQYLGQLEQAQNAQMLKAEIEKCRAEFPETPDAALQAIAEGRLASRRAAEQQANQQRQAEIAAMQQRIEQTVAKARQEADEKAWDEYGVLTGAKALEDIPPRVIELVRDGMTPVAAHWRYQAEQANQQVKIAEKNQTNRQTSPGSVAGNGNDMSDPFLKGFLGL